LLLPNGGRRRPSAGRPGIRAATTRAFAERDEARRLLRRKLQWAKHAEELRGDPDALLALVAELYQELADLRKQLASARQQLQRPASPLW